MCSRELNVTILEKFDQKVDLGILEDFGQVDVTLLKYLTKLIRNRRKTSITTDVEYLEHMLQSIRGDIKITKNLQEGHIVDTAIKDMLFRMYLAFRKHETVITQIVYDYFGNQKPSTNILDNACVIILMLTIYLDEFTVSNIKDMLLKFNSSLTKKIVEFLSSADLEKTMCRYFDREYVDDIFRVSATQEILQRIRDEMDKKSVDIGEKTIKKFVCKPFKTHYVKPVAQPQLNPTGEIDDEHFVFKASPVPYDILNVDKDEIERKREERLKRREMEAKRLREEANKKMFNVAQRIRKKKGYRESDPKPAQKANKFKAKQVHHFPPVEVKTNAAQTLREAANIKREEEQFEKMITGLTNGSLGNFEYENYVEELRKQREIEELENIERRKLQALITHEEAILARQRLIDKNKSEKREFRKQWEEYEMKMNELKEKEMQELKLLSFVETKQREKNIQKKMKNMVEEKYKLAKEEQERIKEDQEKKLKELIEDMERKKEVIRRIKLIQEIARLNNECRVKFDETEVMNNGFMYEMSLAELKVRLSKMEIEMKKELEQKKCEIIQERRKKQKLLEETAKLIEDNRSSKREMRRIQEEMKSQCAKKPSVNINANLDLKLKLIQIRQERLALKN